MAANTSPIFTLTPNVGPASFVAAMTAANTAVDGSGTVNTAFTAGANGGFVRELRFKPAGTNVATVARVFVNNGSTNATATNNSYLGDISLPATTASATVQQPDFSLAFNIGLPAGYKLNVVIATAVAAGWAVTAIGGDY